MKSFIIILFSIQMLYAADKVPSLLHLTISKVITGIEGKNSDICEKVDKLPSDLQQAIIERYIHQHDRHLLPYTMQWLGIYSAESLDKKYKIIYQEELGIHIVDQESEQIIKLFDQDPVDYFIKWSACFSRDNRYLFCQGHRYSAKPRLSLDHIDFKPSIFKVLLVPENFKEVIHKEFKQGWEIDAILDEQYNFHIDSYKGWIVLTPRNNNVILPEIMYLLKQAGKQDDELSAKEVIEFATGDNNSMLAIQRRIYFNKINAIKEQD